MILLFWREHILA